MNYPGEQEAIIDRRAWDRVQAILSENRQYRASQTRRTTAAPLKGILRCGCCDAAMAPHYTTRKGKRYHYYVCHAAGKNGYDTCQVKSVPAGQIEGAVLTYLKKIFADPEMTARTFRAACQQADEERQARDRERVARQDRLSELRQAIGKLIRAAGDKAGGALSDELRALNDEYAAAEKRLRELDAAIDQQKAIPSEQDVVAALRVIDPLWEELFPAEKERIMHLLVESAVVRPDGLTMRLRPTGLMNLAAELEPQQTAEELMEATA
jgi:site-specific DNA recombinase